MNGRPPSQPIVMLFLQAPRTGAVKPRLAADLGEERTLDLYRAMAERQLREVPPGWSVEIHFDPAHAEDDMRAWLGPSRHYRAQGDGDLGRRLKKAFAAAFGRGATTVIAIGSDCPELDQETFHEAVARLSRAELVLGPASTGGYYLLALRRPAPDLFDNIPWSSNQVATTLLARAKLLGLSRELLTPKDSLEDNTIYRAYLGRVARKTAATDSLTVIVPTLNDAATLDATLTAAVQSLPGSRLIVVDGQSSDRTREIAARHGAKIVVTRRGRGHQYRAGAACAETDWLLFLPPDAILPAETGIVFGNFIQQMDVQVATFRLRFDRAHWFLRACGWCTRFDSVFTRFGSQGILIRREFYDALGGFPDWPLFEDVALLQRARAATRIHSLPATVTASARRFNQRGPVVQQWHNARLLIRYLTGTPVAELAVESRRAAPATEPKPHRPAAVSRTPESVR